MDRKRTGITLRVGGGDLYRQTDTEQGQSKIRDNREKIGYREVSPAGSFTGRGEGLATPT